MTKKEYWLKLFEENNVALACAIHLCERFADDVQLVKGRQFIEQKVEELSNIIDDKIIKETFGEDDNE